MYKILTLIVSFLIISCNTDFSSLENDQDEEIYRNYTKIINRISLNSFEDSLIIEAEKVYPDRDSVLAHMSRYIQQSSIPDSNLWFYEVFDGVLIPFAITSEAISYYDDLIDSLNSGNICHYQFIITAKFEYNANISFKETYTFDDVDPLTLEPLPIISYENVFVVDMTLKWNHYCGPVCGLFINHKRIVIFDENGNLLNVFLDGIIPVMVS